jgi:hypothetical protein
MCGSVTIFYSFTDQGFGKYESALLRIINVNKGVSDYERGSFKYC